MIWAKMFQIRLLHNVSILFLRYVVCVVYATYVELFLCSYSLSMYSLLSYKVIICIISWWQYILNIIKDCAICICSTIFFRSCTLLGTPPYVQISRLSAHEWQGSLLNIKMKRWYKSRRGGEEKKAQVLGQFQLDF